MAKIFKRIKKSAQKIRRDNNGIQRIQRNVVWGMAHILISSIYHTSNCRNSMVYTLRRNVSKKELENGYSNHSSKQLDCSFCHPADSTQD